MVKNSKYDLNGSDSVIASQQCVKITHIGLKSRKKQIHDGRLSPKVLKFRGGMNAVIGGHLFQAYCPNIKPGSHGGEDTWETRVTELKKSPGGLRVIRRRL